jgi:hypothetical protein
MLGPSASAEAVFLFCRHGNSDGQATNYLKIDPSRNEFSILQREQYYFNSCIGTTKCKFDNNFYARFDTDGGYLKINRKTGEWESLAYFQGVANYRFGVCEKSVDPTALPNKF